MGFDLKIDPRVLLDCVRRAVDIWQSKTQMGGKMTVSSDGDGVKVVLSGSDGPSRTFLFSPGTRVVSVRTTRTVGGEERGPDIDLDLLFDIIREKMSERDDLISGTMDPL